MLELEFGTVMNVHGGVDCCESCGAADNVEARVRYFAVGEEDAAELGVDPDEDAGVRLCPDCAGMREEI